MSFMVFFRKIKEPKMEYEVRSMRNLYYPTSYFLLPTSLLWPIVPELRFIHLHFLGAECDLHLHGTFAVVVKGFVIVYTMRIAETQGFQFAQVIPSEKGDGAAFGLCGANHPFKQIGRPIAFNDQRYGATLWNGRWFSGVIGGLCKTKSAMQDIQLFTVHF